MKIKKKLYRNKENGMLAGVCAGLSDYFDIDVNVLRIAWVVLALFFGSGIFIYLAATLIIPEKPHNENVIEMVETSTEKKLRLSQENKMLAGVCGGLAEYFDVDVSVIRFIFIILTFVYGIGIITYIILLVFLPEK